MISIPSSEDMLKYEKMEKSGKYTKEELDKFWCEISFPNGEPYSESDVIKQCLNGNPPVYHSRKMLIKRKILIRFSRNSSTHKRGCFFIS